jgi:hypothetical protein
VAANGISASSLAADAGAEIADAVWDEARAGHGTAGTFGEGVASVQGSVSGGIGGDITGDILGDLVGDVGGSVALVLDVVNVATVSGNIGGNVAGSVASVTATVNADVKKINGTTVNGNGSGTPWGP